MFINILLFLWGLALLYLGAEMLVRGASRLAYLARIKPVVIGLTVVAFGTSFPEFITSLVAAFKDKGDVALGNIIGSNIANICLILGISSLIRPIEVDVESVKKEMYWLFASSLLFLLFGFGGYIGMLEGVILFGGIVVFTIILIRSSVQDRKKEPVEQVIRPEFRYFKDLSAPRRLAIYLLIALAGVVLLVLGSERLIMSATTIANRLGVSDIIIGLSLVAFGTSLPELATALISIVRKENDILIGNIIGSNIFNLLFVGGLLAAFFGIPLQEHVIIVDIPVMFVISLSLVPMIFIRKRFSRTSGLLLVAAYIIYNLYIFNS
jgi:cation:H+ antiporter